MISASKLRAGDVVKGTHFTIEITEIEPCADRTGVTIVSKGGLRYWIGNDLRRIGTGETWMNESPLRTVTRPRVGVVFQREGEGDGR